MGRPESSFRGLFPLSRERPPDYLLDSHYFPLLSCSVVVGWSVSCICALLGRFGYGWYGWTNLRAILPTLLCNASISWASSVLPWRVASRWWRAMALDTMADS